ncbi:MAG: hypothetical protein RL660_256 [Bacteroidota bacterium]|jgi:hypothetical protein
MLGQLSRRPVATGVLLYVVMYFIAAQFYPGGTYQNRNAQGFDWVRNFWCNLLDSTSLNGQANTARPLAIAAMALLVCCITYFWYKFPRYVACSKTVGRLIQYCGCAAMLLSGLLLAAVQHDLAINISCFFGAIAICLALYSLYSNKHYFVLRIGVASIALMCANIYFYYINTNLLALAIVQKFAFASFLLWFVFVERLQKRA